MFEWISHDVVSKTLHSWRIVQRRRLEYNRIYSVFRSNLKRREVQKLNCFKQKKGLTVKATQSFEDCSVVKLLLPSYCRSRAPGYCKVETDRRKALFRKALCIWTWFDREPMRRRRLVALEIGSRLCRNAPWDCFRGRTIFLPVFSATFAHILS